MKLLKIVATDLEIQPVQSVVEDGDFFVVIKNHRQACIRRYLRKLRKERLRQKKKQEQRWVEEEERNRNDVLNMNMLGQQNLWEVLIQDQKCEYNSETQQTGTEKISKLEQAVQYVQQLPLWPKRSLFVDEFAPFAYTA